MLISKNLYDDYEESISNLQALLQDEELKRSLRVFNIRFKLANDLQIDYTGEISNTKTHDVKQTYIEIFSLLEFWNTYEALIHYAKEVIEYNDNQSSYLKLKNVLPDNIDNILKKGLERLKSIYVKDQEDFDIYFSRIESNESIGKQLKNNANEILKYLKNEITEDDIFGFNFLGLIYSERNMYYHNGEAAKMGMKYKNRLSLIQLYKEIFPDFILATATFLINHEIASLE